MFYNEENNINNNILNQGKDILNYNNELDNNPHFKLIQKGSIIEGFNSYKLNNKDNKIVEKLQNIEDEFNNTIAEYNRVYKDFNEDVLKKKTQLKDVSYYLGKNIQLPDGSTYYVNNFGKHYLYPSMDEWTGLNPEECPNNLDLVTGDMPSQLSPGANMNIGTPCGAAGQVVKNTETGELAWIDIKGYKHIFPEGTNMSSSCAEMNIIVISNKAYNAIPSGNPMSSDDYCLALDINPKLWDKLNKLNIKLNEQASAISNEIDLLSKQDTNINNKLSNTRNKLNKYLYKIDKDREMLVYNKNIITTTIGEEEDSELRMTSNYYFLIFWFIVMLIIVTLSLTSYSSHSNKISILTYIIIGWFVLLFVYYLYNKFV